MKQCKSRGVDGDLDPWKDERDKTNIPPKFPQPGDPDFMGPLPKNE